MNLRQYKETQTENHCKWRINDTRKNCKLIRVITNEEQKMKNYMTNMSRKIDGTKAGRKKEEA